MIVGNGLIANALTSTDFNHDDLIVFASGVSNSNEIHESSFNREKELLLSLSQHKKKLIYFSTTSVNSEKKSKYIYHKLNMENLVETQFEDYLIIRVPNVVGKTNNKHQLMGYLNSCLINKVPITLFKNEVRFLLDVEDLVKIIKILNQFDIKKTDVFFNNGVTVPKLLSIIEDFTKQKFLIKNEDVSFSKNYSDNTFFISKIKNLNSNFNSDVKTIIMKYLTK